MELKIEVICRKCNSCLEAVFEETSPSAVVIEVVPCNHCVTNEDLPVKCNEKDEDEDVTTCVMCGANVRDDEDECPKCGTMYQ